jgi:hypothetical protein
VGGWGALSVVTGLLCSALAGNALFGLYPLIKSASGWWKLGGVLLSVVCVVGFIRRWRKRAAIRS